MPRPHLLVLAISPLAAAGVAEAATITVTTNSGAVADDGACSLPEAIASANSDSASGGTGGECVAGSAGADVIELPAQTITLTAALPADGLKPVLVARGARGSDLLLVHARRVGADIEVRLDRYQDGLWQQGRWNALREARVALRW